MRRVITLTTDFGCDDAFVGAMKGVILKINPEATIVDVSNDIGPQNVAQAAFLLSTAYRYFPDSTVHLAVVDPGVGTSRRAIILKTPGAFFVAPDNGLLSYVLADHGAPRPKRGQHTAALPKGLEAVSISNPAFMLTPVSATFHGRDVFAPVAAHLSRGVPISEFGEAVTSLVILPLPCPVKKGNSLEGHVLHVDRFGNLITDIRGGHVAGRKLRISILGHTIEGLSANYQEGGDLLALIDSSGYLEVAARNGNASRLIGARAGNTVNVEFVG